MKEKLLNTRMVYILFLNSRVLLLLNIFIALFFISCSDNEAIDDNSHIEVRLSDYLKYGENHSDAIRLCLNDCILYETKVIHFDIREICIDEAILLDSNTTVVLEDCIIKQNNGVFDNVFRGNNLVLEDDNPFGIPLHIDSISNIRIIGRGECKIIGPDVNAKIYHPVRNVEEDAIGDYYGWRTLQISFSLASDIEISGISFEQIRCWAISFDKCSNVSVHDLSIFSDCKNGDGINIRSGCHHCEIYNITGDTSDDTIACSALGRNVKRTYPDGNYIYPMEPTVNLDPTGNMDVFEINIHDISTVGNHHGVILLTAYDNEIYNISISDFVEPENASRNRSSVLYLYTGYGDPSLSNKIHDVNIRNIVSNTAKYVIQSNMKCEDIHVSNLTQNNTNGELYDLKHIDGFEFN